MDKCKGVFKHPFTRRRNIRIVLKNLFISDGNTFMQNANTVWLVSNKTLNNKLSAVTLAYFYNRQNIIIMDLPTSKIIFQKHCQTCIIFFFEQLQLNVWPSKVDVPKIGIPLSKLTWISTGPKHLNLVLTRFSSLLHFIRTIHLIYNANLEMQHWAKMG